jgi:hypothetical protein
MIVALALVLALATACTGGGSSEERDAAVYAAVIRHMTAERGQPSGFPVIYVADRIDPGAADPEAEAAGAPFPQDVKEGILELVQGLGRVEFVADPDSVIGPEEDGSRVQSGGILLTVGPIRGTGDRVEVQASSYLANLAGSWQTWVVALQGDVWRVSGTTGPVATA